VCLQLQQSLQFEALHLMRLGNTGDLWMVTATWTQR